MERRPYEISQIDDAALLRRLAEGTAAEVGARFLEVLVRTLSEVLGSCGAWVTRYSPETRTLRSLAFVMNGEWIVDYTYAIDGTPCGAVVDSRDLVHCAERVIELYPNDDDLKRFNAVSYLGVPLLDSDGSVIGHLAVMDDRPLTDEPRCTSIFRIFAARAAAELRRIRADAELRAREQRLARIFDGAMDAMLELDAGLRVTFANAAAEKVFGCAADTLVGLDLARFLVGDSYRRLAAEAERIDSSRSDLTAAWIAGGLSACRADKRAFSAEATLSKLGPSPDEDAPAFLLVLRDVEDRLSAERTIQSLSKETQYLREEIGVLADSGAIVGNSPALRRVLDDLAQVAPTDSTVLITGETGTGKELIARAIHNAGARRDRPLVTVNCAAIPAALMESEFFGHERGAFTGATAKRDGRFALADGGTIFLDEIGELPIELQPKLLRALQEGEIEPVGSGRTRKIDVRVIAATNRDLRHEIAYGRFRDDLFFRLNVFPIHVPALRERGDDVLRIASVIAEKIARRLGKQFEPLSADDGKRLQAYEWPGNVRELHNVIERAVILARDGHLDLARALPAETPEELEEDDAAPLVQGQGSESASFDLRSPLVSARPRRSGRNVQTVRELQDLERENIMRALESCGWQVSGERGAARMLGMKPSTLASRMKALDIRRPSKH